MKGEEERRKRGGREEEERRKRGGREEEEGGRIGRGRRGTKVMEKEMGRRRRKRI